jgi:hypothetical protein
MKKVRCACLLAVLAIIVSLSSTAQAQSNQRYASPTGAGTTCSASSPCSLFEAIISSPSNGYISCINGGSYATATSFGSSLTIDCPGAVLTPSSLSPSPNPLAALTFTGSSSQVVILRNLTFDGGAAVVAPFLSVTGGATLIIENCKFQNLATSNAIAIQFLPNSPAAQLIIRDSVFANNGIAPGTGGGLQVAPAAGGSASVKLERVSFDFNVTSMVLTGAANATMVNSTMSASRSNGILVGSGSTLFIKDSTLEYNVGSAVSVASGGTLQLSNNDIRSNQTGISNSGGQALTYSNNRIFGNGSSATLASIQGGQ